MRFVFRRDKGASILVLGLLFAAFVVYAITFPKAYAAAPVVNSSTNSGSCGAVSSCASGMTILTANDVIVITVSTQNNGASVNPLVVSTVTDTLGNAYTFQVGQSSKVSAPAANCGATLCGDAEIWTAVSPATGADTVTVTMTGTVAGMIFGQLDVTGISATAVNVQGFACTIVTAATSSCLSGSTATTGPAAFGVNTIEVAASSAVGTAYTLTAGSAAWTFIGGNLGNGASEYSSAGALVTSPTNFPFVKSASGGTTYWADAGAVFGPTSGVVTSTTTVNTFSNNTSNNGTSTFTVTMPNLFVFVTSQNVATGSTVDNFTMKVNSVHINTNTGTGYALFYSAVGIPTGGNPYVLQKTVPITFTNQTTFTAPYFIHLNPQALICASCYFAIGIMMTTTASRGTGASQSGVSFYETSAIQTTNSFAVGSSTPPNTFFSNTIVKPNLFIFYHLIFTVATFTVTSTTTTGGTATTTSTVTSTNTVNQLNMSSANFWFIPMVFLLAPMAFLIVIRRFTGG